MDKIVDKRLVILSAITFCFLISIFLINSNVSYAAPANIPQIVEITPSTLEQNALKVSWKTNNTGNDYSIEVFNNTTKKMQKFAGSVTYYTFKNLPSNQTYNFMVRACQKYTNCTKWSDVKSSSYTNDDFKITLSAKTYVYDGKEKKPTVTVKNKEGITLTTNQDYTVVYPKDMINAGSKTITVRGLGNYAFEQELTYTIKPVTIVPTVTLAKTVYTYTGKDIKPIVTAKVSGKSLTNNKDYVVTYPKDVKSIGTHNVVVKGTYNYSFTKNNLSYKINPLATTVKSVSKTKNSMTVKMTQKAGGVNYQVYYKKASAKSYSSHKSCGTTQYNNCVVTGLAANTKYNIKVRTYKKVSNVSYYSDFSGVTNVTTSKSSKKSSSSKKTSSKSSNKSSSSSNSSSNNKNSPKTKAKEKTCGANQTRNSSGKCECKLGYKKYRDRGCVTYSRYCQLSHGSDKWTNSGSSDKCKCKSGYIKSNGKCVKKNSSSNQNTLLEALKKACKKAGGTFKGNKCVCNGNTTWSNSKQKCVKKKKWNCSWKSYSVAVKSKISRNVNMKCVHENQGKEKFKKGSKKFERCICQYK